MEINLFIRYAIMVFWISETTLKTGICKHISIVLVNTSLSDLESRSYTEVPSMILENSVPKFSSRDFASSLDWKNCLGSADMICDPHNIFTQQNSKL